MKKPTTLAVRSAAPSIISAMDAALTNGSNLLVIGPVTAGKTTTAKHFVKTRTVNAALVEAPPEANERRFYSSILNSLRVDYPLSATSSNLLAQVLAEIKSQKVQMVIIDELNGIFNGPKSRVAHCISSLVALSTKAQIPFVLLSDDSVLSAIHASTVLVAHFPIVTLPLAATVVSPKTKKTVKKPSSKKKAHQARKKAQKVIPTKGASLASGPLQTVVIERCKLDVTLVDDLQRKPLGRPYLTVALDTYSRAITGFALSLDETWAQSIGSCIAHSILPKKAWLKERNVKAKWPISGVPAIILFDSALEFRSPDLVKACASYGINLEWRPLISPHYGGYIEPFIGSVSKALQALPASLTLDELDRWLAHFVVVYHNKVHTAVLATPLAKYAQGQVATGVSPSALDEKTVRLDFLPSFEATIQKYGIRFQGLWYSDSKLIPYFNPKVGKRHVFRYDPQSLDQIYFLDPTSRRYFTIPWVNAEKSPSLSLAELRAMNKAAKLTNHKPIDDAELDNLARRAKKKVPTTAQGGD